MKDDLRKAQIATLEAQGRCYGVAADLFSTETQVRAFMAGLCAARLNDQTIIISDPFHAGSGAWVVLWLNRLAASPCIFTNHTHMELA